LFLTPAGQAETPRAILKTRAIAKGEEEDLSSSPLTASLIKLSPSGSEDRNEALASLSTEGVQ